MTSTSVDLRITGGQPPAFAWNAVAAAVTLIMLLSSAATALAQGQGDPSPAVRQFMDATREYAVLHRQLESDCPGSK